MNTRARVTAIPALLAAGAFASIPGMLKTVTAHGARSQATPEVAAWADLGLPELNLTVTADGVDGLPESIEAGRYLLTVSGEPPSDTSPGGVLILQLPEGMTMDQAMAEDTGEGPPAFYYDALVPGGAMIPESGTSVSIIDLPSGEWVVTDSRLSTPPVMLTVTGEMPADPPVPESNAIFTMDEMVIELSDGELVAGENLLKLENTGDQPHFIDFNKVPEGTTNENIAATLEAEMGGSPAPDAVDFADIQFITSSGDQSSGTTMWMPLTLDAGTYAGICFFPDEETGMPHAMMGMHMVFTVE